MSAFAIRLEEDRVHVFTDAVWADSDGVIRGFGPIFHALPHWPAMVLVCGADQAAHATLADMALRFDSIDALATRVTDFMEEIRERDAPRFNKKASDFQIIAAGWSRRREKPRVLVARPSDTGQDFALYEHHKTLLSTALPREALFFAGLTEEEIEATDPGTYALTTLGGMRAMHLLGLGGPAVGGYLLAATISADGIVQTRQPVRDWAQDCIGSRIGEEKREDAARLPHIEQGPVTFGVPPAKGRGQ
jgi:hypothetical protein